MGNEGCHIQIMEDIIANNQSWRIEEMKRDGLSH